MANVLAEALLRKWLLAALMLVPLGSCVALARGPSGSELDAREAALVLVGFAGLLLSAAVWLGLAVVLFKTSLVRREHRLRWLFALTVWLPLSAPAFYFVYLWRTPEEKAARPDSNRAHLLKMWALIGVVGVALLAGLIAAVARGQYFVPVVVSLFTAGVGVWLRIKQWRLRKVLGGTDPGRILAFLSRESRGLKRASHGDCLYASTMAGWAARMGAFDRARQELASVNWGGRPPLYQGLRDSVAALLALLEERNPEKALALAREARRLADVAGPFPGASRGRAAMDSAIAAMELIAGQVRPDLVPTVEAMARQLPEAQKALPACALAVHFGREGDPAMVDQYQRLLVEVAPSARPMIELAGATPPAVGAEGSARSSWGALVRAAALPGIAFVALAVLLWNLPPDRHQVRHSRPVVIPSPPTTAEGPGAPGPLPDTGALSTMVKDASAAIEAGDNDRAIALLDRVLGASADHGEALFLRAYAYGNKRDHVKAIRDLDRLLRLEPDDAAALDNRGIAYQALGDFDRAIRDYDEAIRLAPLNALAYNNRGRALIDREDFPGAIADFDQALRIKPDLEEARENRQVAVRRQYASEHPLRTLFKSLR